MLHSIIVMLGRLLGCVGNVLCMQVLSKLVLTMAARVSGSTKAMVLGKAGTINQLIDNQSILKFLSDYRLQVCNIDYANYVKKTYFSSHFKHITAKNVQFGALLIIKWEEFPALVNLIGLNTSAEFNRLLIDLKLVLKPISEAQPIPSPSTDHYVKSRGTSGRSDHYSRSFAKRRARALYEYMQYIL